MAVTVLKNVSVVVNSVDLSDHVESLSLPIELDAVEATAMGDATRKSVPGLKGGDITVTFLQDYAASKVDATLWPLINAGTAHTLVVKPDSGAVSTTNPSYTMTVILTAYSPIDGAVGDVQKPQATFKCNSGDLTRATV